MLSVYPACFFKEGNSYTVIFPDLNWLSTCGSSLNETMTAAVDCLTGHLYLLEKEGENIPAPSVMSDIHPEEIAAELEVSADEMFVNMVSVDVMAYAKEHFEKSVKKTALI